MLPTSRRVAWSLTALALLAASTLPVQDASAGVRLPHTVVLDGVTAHYPDHGRQIITVNHTTGYHARVSFWGFDSAAHHWVRRMQTTDGRIGYGGLVAPTKRHQGTGTTPLGSVRLLWTFGTKPARSSWDLTYTQTRSGDYWVEDNKSPYYNRYRNKARGGFRWWLPSSDDNSSERLRDFPTQYEMAAVTSYNFYEQVRYRGAGIFLHVNGRGATAGCVSVPRWFMADAMWRLDPDLRPVMAVGR